MASMARRTEALVQAGMILASELSLPAVLQKIIDLACDVADARFGALGVVGADGRIEEFITHGVTEAERRAIGSLPEGLGILGILISDARPLRLRRIQDHPLSYGFPANHPPMRSFLGVPIKVRDIVFGNLYLTEKLGTEEFTAEDEEAVITLASQAGVAIENAHLYQTVRANEKRLAAVNRVTGAILEGRPTGEVLQLTAAYARELAGAAMATVAVPHDADTLVLSVAVGDHADEMRGMRFPTDGSLSGEVMRTRQPMLLADAAERPHAHQPLVTVGSVGPAMLVPLAVADRPFGALAVGNPRGGRIFTDADLALVQLFAAQAAVVLEYGRVRSELQRFAVIEDRERIAKELHDGVVQSLFAVGMALQATEAVAGDADLVRKRLDAAVDDIDHAIRDLRNYIFALRPGEMADWQLVRSLQDLAEDFGQTPGVTIATEIDPDVASTLTTRAVEIVQAAREAVSNAVRHSGGDRIDLRLAARDGGAVLEVTDNGAGFDPEHPMRKGHGLGNLGARAAALSGTLIIDSAPGRGTSIRITMPL